MGLCQPRPQPALQAARQAVPHGLEPVREAPRASGARFDWAAFGAFKQPAVLGVSAIGLIVFLVIVGANQLINPALTEKLGIDLSTAGLVTTVWGIGCVAGAVGGGLVMDRIGNKTALWACIISVFVTLALLAIALLVKGL